MAAVEVVEQVCQGVLLPGPPRTSGARNEYAGEKNLHIHTDMSQSTHFIWSIKGSWAIQPYCLLVNTPTLRA